MSVLRALWAGLLSMLTNERGDALMSDNLLPVGDNRPACECLSSLSGGSVRSFPDRGGGGLGALCSLARELLRDFEMDLREWNEFSRLSMYAGAPIIRASEGARDTGLSALCSGFCFSYLSSISSISLAGDS